MLKYFYDLKEQKFQKISGNFVKAENSPAQVSFVLSRKPQYKDVFRRTIEILQHKVMYKVHSNFS